MYSQPSQKCCFDPGGDWCNGVNASLKLEMSDWQIWLNQGMMVRERRRAPQGRTKATLLSHTIRTEGAKQKCQMEDASCKQKG